MKKGPQVTARGPFIHKPESVHTTDTATQKYPISSNGIIEYLGGCVKRGLALNSRENPMSCQEHNKLVPAPDHDNFSNARRFIARVAPWTDGAFVNLHYFSKSKKPNGKPFLNGTPTQSVKEFIEAVSFRANHAGTHDLYFCTSSQSQTKLREDNGRHWVEAVRAVETAVELKAFWLDVDVGKTKDGQPHGYQTTQEAVAGIRTFRQFTQMPPPNAAVMSGNGYHFYWALKHPMKRDDWRPYADALVAAGLEAGLQWDSGVTSDCARILRVPDTWNYKSDPPKPVTLKFLADEDYQNELILSRLRPWLGKSKASPAKGTPSDPEADELGAGIGGPEYPPQAIEKAAERCPWLAGSLATGGVDNDNWLRRYAFSIAVRCTEPRETAWRLMGNRETLTPEEFDLEFDRVEKEHAAGQAPLASCAQVSKYCTLCATCDRLKENKFPLSGSGAVAVGNLPTVSGEKGKLFTAFNALARSGIELTYDAFHDVYLVNGNEMDDDAITKLRFIIGKDPYVKSEPGKDATYEAARVACRERTFNPVTDYLASLVWDGEPRLDTWLQVYCKAKDTPFIRAAGRKWLIAMVRRARQPGCKFDFALVLISPEGKGKSSLGEILAGGKSEFTDSPLIHLGAKDQVDRLRGKWIVELCELADFKKADEETVKAFLSRQVDRARPSYGRCAKDYPRTCVFFGTTNKEQFLQSFYGNRRFWPVDVGTIDRDGVERDRDQLLAEAAAMDLTGESIGLPEALWGAAAAEQKARRIRHDWEDVLERIEGKILTTSSNMKFEVITNEELFDCAHLDIPMAQRRGAGERAKKLMEDLGWTHRIIKKNKKTVRAYVRPA